jgi:hypothetical protein
MDRGNRIEITDKNGWQRELPLEKNLIHIGSEPRNDIVLELGRGSGVAPRHLQLVSVQGDRQRYRAINLGDTDILFGDAGDAVLSPRSSADIVDGARLKLGDFTLVFHLGRLGREGVRQPVVPSWAHAAAETAVQTFEQETSAAIGLRLILPGAPLDPERPLEGSVVVHNLGNKPGVQFKLEVEGLEPDCYEMGPGPILFPNVEKAVFLRLYHPRGPRPVAGDHTIRIRATAPEAYPGESTTVSRGIQILPFYNHALRLMTVD